ncbi:MAG: DNA adenine methylase, partial [Planctomycetota bacterium]
MKTKSPLSYFGSDASVAAELASHLNHCRHVTIPFVGGASIIQHLSASHIVANDKLAEAITFYRVLCGDYGVFQTEALISRCESTLSHPSELDAARMGLHALDPVSIAWSFWALCWVARKGKGGTDRTGDYMSARRKANGGNNASRIRTVAKEMRQWAKSFRNCEWECSDYAIVLSKCADDPQCGIYCDPPWFGAGRHYQHKFTMDDHARLRDALQRFTQTTVLVRYGDDDRVRDLYGGWTIEESTARDQCNQQKPEL